MTGLRGIDKRALLEAVLGELEATRTMMAEAAAETRAGATHPEARSEGSKDMRSTEQSYLARGQAMRVEELEEQLVRLRFFEARAFGADDAIAAGALVRLEGDEGARLVFVLPYGGGTEVRLGDDVITVVTGTSPLGRAVLGRCAGDELELRIQGRARELEIVEVA